MTRECFGCGRAVAYAEVRCPACGEAMSAVEHMREFWNAVADAARGDIPDERQPPKGENDVR